MSLEFLKKTLGSFLYVYDIEWSSLDIKFEKMSISNYILDGEK